MSPAGQQGVRRRRAPGAGGVKFVRLQRLSVPSRANGIHQPPRGFHFILADEKRGVAGQRIQQESFNARVCRRELRAVAEVHAHRTDDEIGAGTLPLKPGLIPRPVAGADQRVRVQIRAALAQKSTSGVPPGITRTSLALRGRRLPVRR